MTLATTADRIVFAEDWCRALTFAERAALPRRGVPPAPARANRLARWQKQLGVDSGLLARLYALTPGEAERLVATPPETLADPTRLTSPWVDQWLSDLNDRAPRAASYDTESLLTPFAGLMRSARQVVHELALSTKPAILDPAETALAQDLGTRLYQATARVMVLELNVARLEGRLTGRTGEERFRDYCASFRDARTTLALLREYPVLGRVAATTIDRWQVTTREMLERLAGDWAAIQARLAFHPDDRVASFARAGDIHGGRAVHVIGFESGRKLIYKPRSISLFEGFQRLLRWCNDSGWAPGFRTLATVDRGDYGWVEFAEHMPCADRDAVERFYRRAGGTLALLYALGTTDIHYENVVASGEHPVIVDLDTLIVPRARVPGIPSPVERLLEALSSSVLRVGLLPQLIWGSPDAPGVDLSGFGGRAGQVVPIDRFEWGDLQTDQMHAVTGTNTLEGARNRPVLGATVLEAPDFTEVITDGFEAMYCLLQSRRASLLSAGGCLESLGDGEVRVIVRPTAMYEALYHRSIHPDFMRDALDRDALFATLALTDLRHEAAATVLSQEIAQLSDGDIPIFSTRAGSRNLDLAHPARLLVRNFFEESALDTARRQVEQLHAEDCERQTAIIRCALVVNATSLPQSEKAFTLSRRGARADEFIDAADAIGRRLRTLASVCGELAGWHGLVPAGSHRWQVAPIGPDLYAGTIGIALFLGYLDRVRPDPAHRALARAALQSARLALVDESLPTAPGAFSGLAGLAYGLLHLGTLWKDSELLDDAQRACDRLPRLLAADPSSDIISGAAGVIAVLRVFQAMAPSSAHLAAMRVAAESLVQNGRVHSAGIGWDVAGIPAEGPLTGFSHGTAGIAWALDMAHTALGDDVFKHVSHRAVAYERSLFDATAGNWRDLRTLDNSNQGQRQFVVAWCHGAAGIGLARLHMANLAHDDAFAAEIRAATAATARAFGENQCLCHGDLGNLELLRAAAQQQQYDPALVAACAAAILDSIRTDGWSCGVPNGVETPGLLTGLAGIGMGLLRCAAADRVPSILMLDPFA